MAREPVDAVWWRSRSALVLCGFLAVAGFLLLFEHTAHVFGALPYLLILACPLMHLFMHRGHGHSHDHRAAGGDGSKRSDE